MRYIQIAFQCEKSMVGSNLLFVFKIPAFESLSLVGIPKSLNLGDKYAFQFRNEGTRYLLFTLWQQVLGHMKQVLQLDVFALDMNLRGLWV